MTIAASVKMTVSVAETVTTASEVATGATGSHNLSQSASLSEGSTPPATKAFSDEIQLASGTSTLDLTNLLDIAQRALDLSGLKVQTIMLAAPDTNTEPVTVEPAASNGYDIFGDASGHIALPPGCSACFQFHDDLPDVAPTAKDIAIASADADAKLKVVLIAG